MKVKICGVTRECEIDFVNLAMPDYVGFVFAKSRFMLTQKTAESFRRRMDSAIKAVGVFADDDIGLVNRLLEKKIIDIVQLHGDEDDEYIDKVEGTVIKAVRAGQTLERPCEYLLFDKNDGGGAQPLEWRALPQTDKPFFLAGGINIDNVYEVMALNPYGIDISSGVETCGKKDKDKILDIVRRIHDD